MIINSDGKPELRQPDPPPVEMVREQNARQRDLLLERAGAALSPLQTAIMLGEANDEEVALAREWIAYTRAVKAVSLSESWPEWPAMPEIGGSN